MRVVPYNSGCVLPGWLSEPPVRPRIAVYAEFILAVGDAGTGELGTLPANVRASGWVPLSDLLPTYVGLIHHGGAGLEADAATIDAGTVQRLLDDGALRRNAREVQAEIAACDHSERKREGR